MSTFTLIRQITEQCCQKEYFKNILIGLKTGSIIGKLLGNFAEE